MSVQQLSDYIVKNLKKGYTMDSLKFSLMGQGYTRISVENAINLANKKLAEEIPTIKEKPRITYKVIEEEPGVRKEIKRFIDLGSKKTFWGKLFRN